MHFYKNYSSPPRLLFSFSRTDLKFNRVSSLSKDETRSKLEQEVPIQKIVRQNFDSLLEKSLQEDPTPSETDFADPDAERIKKKPLGYNDVWRLKHKLDFAKFDLDEKDEVGNVFKLLEKEEFLGFNFDSVLKDCPNHKSVSEKKIIGIEQMILVFMSNEMRQKFRCHPYTLAVDGTHSTNSLKSILITILAFGK